MSELLTTTLGELAVGGVLSTEVTTVDVTVLVSAAYAKELTPLKIIVIQIPSLLLKNFSSLYYQGLPLPLVGVFISAICAAMLVSIAVLSN